jgi:hypothetical protein
MTSKKAGELRRQLSLEPAESSQYGSLGTWSQTFTVD